MKMKLTGASFYVAALISSYTFALIWSKRGLKKDTMSAAGRSIELAPLCFT
jgi:hypothetical protein